MFESLSLRKWVRKVSRSTRVDLKFLTPNAARLRVEALEDRTLPAGPVVILVDPPENSNTGPTSTNISATFDQAINGSTVSTQSFVVHSSASGQLVGSAVSSLTASGSTVTLDPSAAFFPGEHVEVTVTSGITNAAGEGATPFVSQFWTSVQDGTGFFVESGQVLSNLDSRRVRVGDLDGDGDLDAFVANYSNQPEQVWFNDGAGHFTNSGQSLGSGHSIDADLGDLDGDGDLDAFVTNRFGQGNRVWFNDGAGHFADSGQVLGNHDSWGVALGDVDGDGDLDAFVATGAYQPDRVWFNDGAGHFTDSGQALGNFYSNRVALGDLEGDGDLDAIVANSAGQQSRVWVNNGLGIFTAGAALSRDGLDVSLGDVDADGDLDVLLSVPNQTRLWRNNGAGVLTDVGGFATGYRTGPLLGDLDGDADLDLFAANLFSPSRVWFNNGTGNFTDSGQQLNTRNALGALGDLDGDGDLDAFAANIQSQGNQIWLNTGFIVDAGGPYTIAEGSALTLDASGSFGLGSLLTFRWDVDGDGDFDENVTGSTPTLTWAQLVGLGINDGPAMRTVTVEARFGTTARIDSATLTVNNVAPTDAIAGPSSGVRGQPRTFTLSATDPSPVDQAAGFTFTIDWDDGNMETLTELSGTDVEHVFTETGTYTVTVTATDKDGGVSKAFNHAISVVVAEVQNGVLVVGGTTGDDEIQVKKGAGDGMSLEVIVSGINLGEFAGLTRAVVYGQAGDDDLDATGSTDVELELYGGAGNDHLKGGAKDDILDGGSGGDELIGGLGRDILIGGAGADSLVGQNGEDILIGGLFLADEPSLEIRRAALVSVAGVWSSGESFNHRVNELSAYLNPRVEDDGVTDVLTGGGGSDWYFANTTGPSSERDVLTDLTPDDLVTTI